MAGCNVALCDPKCLLGSVFVLRGSCSRQEALRRPVRVPRRLGAGNQESVPSRSTVRTLTPLLRLYNSCTRMRVHLARSSTCIPLTATLRAFSVEIISTLCTFSLGSRVRCACTYCSMRTYVLSPSKMHLIAALRFDDTPSTSNVFVEPFSWRTLALRKSGSVRQV